MKLGAGIQVTSQAGLTSYFLIAVFLHTHTPFMSWLPVAADMYFTNLATPEKKRVYSFSKNWKIESV